MEVDVEELYTDSCLEDSTFYDFGDFDKAYEEVTVFESEERTEEEEPEWPMMNYVWGLPETYTRRVDRNERNPHEDGKSLENLPTVLLRIGNDWDYGYFIGLTGGGMDLSWEIAESYIRLGYQPPFKVAKLPNMAGKRDTNRNRTIINACKRTFESVKQRSERAIAKLDGIKEELA